MARVMDNFMEIRTVDLKELPAGYPTKCYQDLEGVLVSEEDISRAVSHIAESVNKYYQGIAYEELVIVPVLQGALPFYTDLMRQLRLPLVHDSFQVSSYNGKKSSGEYRIVKDLSGSIKGKHVLVVEDIVDTGGSAVFMREHFEKREPKSIKMASMFVKPSRRKVDFQPDFSGFIIKDYFIVGYGLDCDQRYRELPFVASMKSD